MSYEQLLERLKNDLPQAGEFAMPSWLTIILWIITISTLFPIFFSCFVITKQKYAKVIENLGRFAGIKRAGLSIKMPWPIGKVVGTINLKIREFGNEIGVKSKDNAFLVVPVKVQYKIIKDKVKESFYELDSLNQIISYVVNVVRSKANDMTMDEIFQSKDAFETEVSASLNERFTQYGVTIVNVLVDDPQPSDELKKSFDKVLAAKRDQEASNLEKEAIKNRIVGKAEADAESLKLKAAAYVDMRKIMANGNRESIEMFCSGLDITHIEALNYFEGLDMRDAIRDASTNGSAVIITNGRNGGLENITALQKTFNPKGDQ